MLSKPQTHLPCCCYSRLNGRHQNNKTIVHKTIAFSCFSIFCSSWCSHWIKWKAHLSKLNEKNCPLLWQLLLGRGLQPTKQFKQMLQIIAKQLMLLLKTLAMGLSAGSDIAACIWEQQACVSQMFGFVLLLFFVFTALTGSCDFSFLVSSRYPQLGNWVCYETYP